MQKRNYLSRNPVISSRHAQIRRQQRCIPDAIRDLLLDFGVSSAAGSGAERYIFNKKSWRRVQTYLGAQAKYFERYKGTFIVMSDDGAVITEGWIH